MAILSASLIRDGLVTAAHDISDGGLLVALAEMAMASGIGAVLEASSALAAHAFWFGEDQGRYILTAKNADLIAQRAKAAGVAVDAARCDRRQGFGDCRRTPDCRCAAQRVVRELAAGLHGGPGGVAVTGPPPRSARCNSPATGSMRLRRGN